MTPERGEPGRPRDWDQVWRDLRAWEPAMPEQGREYLGLARRLLEANQALMEIPQLEQEAYEEVESILLLMGSIGGPDEGWLVDLIDLLTHLLERLYVRLEYLKWEVSPLSQLPVALAALDQEELNNSDREVFAFLSAFDRAVRSGRGLAEPATRERLLARADQVSAGAQQGAQRPLRAWFGEALRLLRYYHAQAPDAV
ncbi:MAG: hypothetical protein ACOX2L_05480 [Anaerolineae bacterium]|jgi:hypothetical protein|nr:hypothetical protein [Chloroflexota bacterium]